MARLGVEQQAMVESCVALSIGAGQSSQVSPAEVALHSSGNSHFGLAHSTTQSNTFPKQQTTWQLLKNQKV
jgi:AICAR transformylase/IMP cyclohydrolase PurH